MKLKWQMAAKTVHKLTVTLIKGPGYSPWQHKPKKNSGELKSNYEELKKHKDLCQVHRPRDIEKQNKGEKNQYKANNLLPN
ncbi:hypothetical protein ES319_A02G061100v1 [Gossypium barbadense]|uniref:Uncharacterized protein n=2 Tax=Gossypium TaxID=3633 RepID=A0A5J5WNU5_GOSBA|nr:hypothetical protein ES319_A02G061100v1 [Gossypium barbadense]TYH27413.1 hypothetical protein ES288_A02G068500v1 [Gossypium darwinii]